MKKFFLLAFVLFTVLTGFGQNNNVYAYIIDNSGTPTNVRNSTNGKVVAQLDPDENCVVELLSVKNNWWRIAPEVITEGDNPRDFSLKGSKTGYWIHYSLIYFGIAGDPTSCVRTSPSYKASVVSLEGCSELIFHPLAISGKWIKVVSDDKRVKGWMPTDRICFNPLTTCP